MTDAERIAELEVHLDMALVALRLLRQQLAAFTDMDAANEPEPVDVRPVMPIRAMRHRQHTPGDPWGPL
jgi:hypothetical protein